MKRRLLATLKVYESPDNCVSGLQTHFDQSGTIKGNYELYLCPNGHTDGMGLEQKNRVQIMAHELGHFVAHVLNLPEHAESRKATVRAVKIGLPKDSTLLAPTEQEAWNVGEMIEPGAKLSDAYRISMTGYNEHDSQMRKAIEELDPEPRAFYSTMLLGKDVTR